jgi:hypothetical protein
MTAGVAAYPALDLDWVARALTAAEFTDFKVQAPRVLVNTEVGRIYIRVTGTDGLLHFKSAVYSGARAFSVFAGARSGAFARLQDDLHVARITHYDDGPNPAVQAEYDVPILAGLSRGQFVSMLRAFTADVAVARGFDWEQV